MILVGLTGGIGSGKSTVSAALAALGAVLIDADAVSRELQQPGGSAYVAMVEHFGADILSADGTLDRPKIAAMVFPNPDLLKQLNALVHPLLGTEIRSRLRAHLGTDDIVVLDVPLLIENLAFPVSAVIVVDTPVEVAVDRLVRQRGMDEADARARIARQATREERLARADFVVDNGGDREHLAEQIPTLWAWVQAVEQVDPADPRFLEPEERSGTPM